MENAKSEEEAERMRREAADHEAYLREQLALSKAQKEQEMMRRLAEKRKRRMAAAKDNYEQEKATVTN